MFDINRKVMLLIIQCNLMTVVFLGTAVTVSAQNITTDGNGLEKSVSTSVNATQHLQSLDWLVGQWELKSDDVHIQCVVDWSQNKNYLISRNRINSPQGRHIASIHIIVWNPVSELFESYIFCNDGSFGNAIWQRYDDVWQVSLKMILFNGESLTSTEFYTPVENGFTWQSVSRTLNGTPLPEIDTINAVKVQNLKIPEIF